MKSKRRLHYKLTAFLLIVVILMADAAFIIGKKSRYSELENRNLQQFPALTAQSLYSGRFESLFDTFVSDQFPLRSQFVQIKTLADRLTGKTESNDVFLCADGYLIRAFNDPEEQDYLNSVSAISALKQKYPDVAQYMMMVPSAVSVLNDKLPSCAQTDDENAYIDRLYADLTQNGIQCIDVRNALRNQTEQMYYRTGHHWTSQAAYIAYLSAAGELCLAHSDIAYEKHTVSDSFSGTLVSTSGFRLSDTDTLDVYLPVNEQEVTYAVYYYEEDIHSATIFEPSALENRNKYEVFFGGNHSRIDLTTFENNGRVLLLFKDSYANCFVQFLILDFDKSVFLKSENE